MTLGLWHVAAGLDVQRRGVLDAVRVAESLADISDAVARQASRLAAPASADQPGTPA
jgi:hypothetical protein